MSLHVKDGGVWKTAIPSIKDGGVWKAIKQLYVKDAGTWKTVFALFTEATVDATDFSDLQPTPTITVGPALASPIGGSGSYSYAWSKISGGAITAATPSAASTNFTATGMTAVGTVRSATFKCAVTDTVYGGTFDTPTVTVTLERA